MGLDESQIKLNQTNKVDGDKLYDHSSILLVEIILGVRNARYLVASNVLILRKAFSCHSLVDV